MKNKINIKEVGKYECKSIVFTILKITILVLFLPMAIFLETNGIIIWMVLATVSMVFDIINEKAKIENDKRITCIFFYAIFCSLFFRILLIKYC